MQLSNPTHIEARANTRLISAFANIGQILDIRVAFEKAQIAGDELTELEYEIKAHLVGKHAQLTNQQGVPKLFQNVPALNLAWNEGWNAAIHGGGWWGWSETTPADEDQEDEFCLHGLDSSTCPAGCFED
jgi:hypothetical protein